ncbi:hypothetical protein GUITHDRAFT_132566 [Guillardia theta CCMP2712]|uniref:Uncharacterized protein n=1 Tax=Guillardia theta (strain CCMP2712) TaxID=905079 RepID=L1K135_GUITC|nr:hypothetical protein GUITHDRAFT_132566 [Guillardia theta CCMP2712]EKX54170.1 hypothetical protein GUITHDRAFT_132566 [Guillardia theta CCMP2712]|eukprot:XP_005841150.1 hypothetical protein GUITHDRAFT_132566 [Guillardia theta CCMP2712]
MAARGLVATVENRDSSCSPGQGSQSAFHNAAWAMRIGGAAAAMMAAMMGSMRGMSESSTRVHARSIKQVRVEAAGSMRARGTFGTDMVWYSIKSNTPASTVVFFGGDILSIMMILALTADDEDILRLSKPENIIALLQEKFKSPARGSQNFTVGNECVNVFVIEPTRVQDGVWSCFDNFMESTRSGEPTKGYAQQGKALLQLSSLLRSTMRSVPEIEKELCDLGRTVLVGFSKGGVVLNQMLAELSAGTAKSSSSELQLQEDGDMSNGNSQDDSEKRVLIDEVHYVDAGLNSRGAYLTHPEIIESDGSDNAFVPADMRARQICRACRSIGEIEPSRRRKWVGDEKDRMVALMRKNKMSVTERIYMEEEEASLAMHFRCTCLEAMNVEQE